MKFALIQYSPEWENIENNIVTLEEILNDTVKDVDAIIFPEMTLTGFTMHSKEFAQDIDSSGMLYFINKSSKLKKHIFAGIIELDKEKYFNTLFHFDNKGIITARYRKIHLFSPAKENKFYNAAKEPVITKIGNVHIGLSICYDLRFPELYRFYAKQKVEVIIDIANWPVPRIEHWKTLLKARAIENQCFMIGVNRVGKDPFNEYSGCSTVYDPMGNELLSAGNEEMVFTVDLDISKVKKVREDLPFLDDMKLINF